MPRSQELHEKAKDILARARAAFDKADAAAKAEKRDVTSAEQAEFRKAMDEYDAVKAAASDALRLEQAESELSPRASRSDDSDPKPGAVPGDSVSGVTDDVLADAMRGWLFAQSKPSLVTERHIAAAKRAGFDLRDKEIGFRLRDTGTIERSQKAYRTMSANRAWSEARALSTQIGASGGFSIAPNFNSSIESAMLYYGPMLQVAEIIRTSTGADWPMMTDNETTKTGSYVGENTAITTAEGVTFAQTVLKSYKATTNAILVPYELLRDSSFNLPQYLGSKLGERLGRFINTETTTGAVKVRGITNRSTSGKTTASATAITADELLDLVHSVDVAYRQGASWMMHDNIALALRKLKDGSGGYLWTDGYQAGQPDRLLGFSVFVNNDMQSSVATATKTIEFGQLDKYKIRIVDDIRITTTDERYWEYDQTAFAAYVNFDGDLLDAGTSPVKHMTQA